MPGRIVCRIKGGKRDNILRIKLNGTTPLQPADELPAPGHENVWEPVAGRNGCIAYPLQLQPGKPCQYDLHTQAAQHHHVAPPPPADDSHLWKPGHGHRWVTLQPESQATLRAAGMSPSAPMPQAHQHTGDGALCFFFDPAPVKRQPAFLQPQVDSSSSDDDDQQLFLSRAGAATRPLQPLRSAHQLSRQPMPPQGAWPSTPMVPPGCQRIPLQQSGAHDATAQARRAAAIAGSSPQFSHDPSTQRRSVAAPLLPLLPGQRGRVVAAAPPCKRPPPPLPASTPPPLHCGTPPPPLPLDTPPPLRGPCAAESGWTAAPPLPPESTQPPPPPDSPLASAGAAPSSPLVPAFIQQLWQRRGLHLSASMEGGEPLLEHAGGQAAAAGASAARSQQLPSASDLRDSRSAASSDSTTDKLPAAPPGTGGARRAGEPSCCAATAAEGQDSSTSFPVGQQLRSAPALYAPSAAGCEAPGRMCLSRSAAGDGDSSTSRGHSERGSRLSSRRERNLSCSTVDMGDDSDSDGCSSRRRGGRRGGRRAQELRRRSRSPLRHAGGGHAVAKRTCSRRAPPSSAQGPQLGLASLVDSMSAEAASLQRRLGQMSLAGAEADGGRAGREAMSTSAAATADVERQLAALSSKLGELTCCLSALQQQQAQQAVHHLPAGSQAGAASEGGVTYLCWDTNVWMDQLKLIRECWKRLAGSGVTGLRFLLPLAVLRELDGLKRCLFRGFWARRAVRKLGGMQGHPALRGQREDELHRGQVRHNDDGILDALLLFRRRGAQVELCTRDANLALRARIEGIPCHGPEAMRRRFMRFLDESGTPAGIP